MPLGDHTVKIGEGKVSKHHRNIHQAEYKRLLSIDEGSLVPGVFHSYSTAVQMGPGGGFRPFQTQKELTTPNSWVAKSIVIHAYCEISLGLMATGPQHQLSTVVRVTKILGVEAARRCEQLLLSVTSCCFKLQTSNPHVS
jgi:hypothetical protein